MGNTSGHLMFTVGLNVIWFSKPWGANIRILWGKSPSSWMVLIFCYRNLKHCFHVWMLLSVENRTGNFIQLIIPSWLTVKVAVWLRSTQFWFLDQEADPVRQLFAELHAPGKERECKSSQPEEITSCDWSRERKLSMGLCPRWHLVNYTVPRF